MAGGGKQPEAAISSILGIAGAKKPPFDGLWKSSSSSYLFEKVPLTRSSDGTTF